MKPKFNLDAEMIEGNFNQGDGATFNTMNNYGSSQQSSVPMNFLVNRYTTRKKIKEFIDSDEKTFIITYKIEDDIPYDIISWIREYIKSQDNYLMDLSFKEESTEKLEDIFSDFIEFFTYKNYFKRYWLEVLNKEKKTFLPTSLRKMFQLKQNVSENKILEIIKSDLDSLTQLIVCLDIDSFTQYRKINYIFDNPNIKVIIITKDGQFQNRLKDVKFKYLKDIKPMDIKKFLLNSLLEGKKLREEEIENFINKIDSNISHNSIKEKICKYFELHEPLKEGM